MAISFCDTTRAPPICRGTKPLGDPCLANGDCASGSCADGVCCNETCDSPCTYCRMGAYTGTCRPVPDGDDPRRECQPSSGGTPACAGKCQAGQCAYPDVGTPCGLCAACDGTGRCQATPDDDPACGTIACGALDTACRTYQDLTANRCAALGTCKAAADPASCTQYHDLACTDAGTPPDDAGQPGADGGGDPGGAGGCGCVGARRGSSLPVAVAALLGLVLRRRRPYPAASQLNAGPARSSSRW